MWLLSGDTNIRFLRENGVGIWNEWADENGDLGPIYGKQWRAWPDYDGGSIDQVRKIVQTAKKDPNSRRMIVNAWNVAQIDKMALAPCHAFFQIGIYNRNGIDELDLSLYQRSGDIFIGVPFNIVSYALLTHVIANELELKPGYFIHNFGDLHAYCGSGKTGKFYAENLDTVKKMIRDVNKREDYVRIRDELLDMQKVYDANGAGDHVPHILLQLSREPKPLPKLILDKRAGIDNLLFEYVKIEGYDAHPHIKGDVAV